MCWTVADCHSRVRRFRQLGRRKVPWPTPTRLLRSVLGFPNKAHFQVSPFKTPNMTLGSRQRISLALSAVCPKQESSWLQRRWAVIAITASRHALLISGNGHNLTLLARSTVSFRLPLHPSASAIANVPIIGSCRPRRTGDWSFHKSGSLR
jgi:hypothetical protein